MRTASAVVGLLVALLALAAGCARPPAPAPAGADGSAPASSSPKPSAARGEDETMGGPAKSTGEASAPAEERVLAKQPDADLSAKPDPFGWSTHPALEGIPAQPLSGSVVGKPFAPAKVAVELEGGKPSTLRLTLIEDLATAGPGSLVDVGLQLGAGVTTGDKWVKGLDADPGDASAFYRTVSPDDEMVSLNPTWSCALTVEGGLVGVKPGQTVKGRLWLCFGDEARSWLGGAFEAAVEAVDG